MIQRIAAILLLAGIPVLPAAVRLYLTDGSYQLAREYEVKDDRVRFYSTERGQWEEVPLDLIDLERTERERSERDEEIARENKTLEAEEKAERALIKEVSKVPMNPGAYFVAGQEVDPIPQAEPKVVASKKRSVLRVMAPIPIVASKATIEVDGKTAATLVSSPEPEFYLRLSALEMFALVKLKVEKDSRVVQTWEIAPVSEETLEKHEEVEIFKQELGANLYKIWPVKPLTTGEYAVIQWAPGQRNVQIWDFRYQAPK
jgi:hypothetical protein